MSDWIDYPALVAQALRGLVRELLLRVIEHGMPQGHELFLSFRTDHPRAELPEFLRQQYPEQITIVLRPRSFQELEVADTAFAVTLQFGATPARVTVPFGALLRIVDAGASFGLDLLPEPAPVPASAPASGPHGDAKVVAFPKRRKPGS